jgi:hypothetical protein
MAGGLPVAAAKIDDSRVDKAGGQLMKRWNEFYVVHNPETSDSVRQC